MIIILSVCEILHKNQSKIEVREKLEVRQSELEDKNLLVPARGE